MRNIIHQFKEQSKAYLTFNYAERRGIMVLVILILTVEGVSVFLPQVISKETTDFSDLKEDIRQFEIALAQPDTLPGKADKKKQQKQYHYPNNTYKKAAPAKPPMIVEINTADSAKLVGLYGIGAVFADRILKYRGLLGGFYTKEQLLEVYGMDSTRYDQLKDQIKVSQDLIVKIPVNNAEFKTLLRHPYLDYETVKSIVNYRQKNDSIPNADTLRKVIAYDPMFEKVKSYIEY